MGVCGYWWAFLISGIPIIIMVIVTIVLINKCLSALKLRRLRKIWDLRDEDVVTLHMFPRATTGPNSSPFAVKLEMFLRMAKIKYIPDFEEPLSQKGKTPWITLNGQDLSDSQLIVEYLAKYFDQDFESDLSDESKAISRSIRILLEDHFYWCYVLELWSYNGCRDLSKIYPKPARFIPDWMFLRMLRLHAKMNVLPNARGAGMARHSRSEVERFGKADLTAVSNFLGTKNFLLGDKPCLADLSLFGILSAITSLPSDSKSELKSHLEEDCCNLIKFHQRMIDAYWPDYDQCKFGKENNVKK